MPSSTFSSRHATDHDAGAARSATSGRSGSVIKSLFSGLRARHHHQPLEALDDHMLQDIGLTRADLAAFRL